MTTPIITTDEAMRFCLYSRGHDRAAYEQDVIDAIKAVEEYLGYPIDNRSPQPIKVAALMIVNGTGMHEVRHWLNPYLEN